MSGNPFGDEDIAVVSLATHLVNGAITAKEWQREISLGLTRQEFILHYQPKVNMRAGTVVGFEALIRWQHPQQGLLQPAAFIPWIEDHESIEQLGDWVVGQAIRQSDEWRATGLRTSIAANVTPRHLLCPDFIERLTDHLQAAPRLHAGALELEIAETSVIADWGQARRVINSCKDMGVAVALDDFGTGYTSLIELRELPVTVLKLDQSLVMGVVDGKADKALVEGLVLMTKRLGINLIAEGVETQAQGIALMALGCTFGQGFAIACPMPPTDVPGWTALYERTPLWGRDQTFPAS